MRTAARNATRLGVSISKIIGRMSRRERIAEIAKVIRNVEQVFGTKSTDIRDQEIDMILKAMCGESDGMEPNDRPWTRRVAKKVIELKPLSDNQLPRWQITGTLNSLGSEDYCSAAHIVYDAVIAENIGELVENTDQIPPYIWEEYVDRKSSSVLKYKDRILTKGACLMYKEDFSNHVRWRREGDGR